MNSSTERKKSGINGAGDTEEPCVEIAAP